MRVSLGIFCFTSGRNGQPKYLECAVFVPTDNNFKKKSTPGFSALVIFQWFKRRSNVSHSVIALKTQRQKLIIVANTVDFLKISQYNSERSSGHLPD